MAGRIKFYTDEHVPRAVARGLRNRGVDVVSVPEAGMMGAADDAHLARALSEGRVVLTQDDDLLKQHARGVEHAGIVYGAQGMGVGEMIRGAMLVYQLLEAEEMRGHVEFL